MTKFIFWHSGDPLRLWVHCGTAVIYLIKGCIIGTQVTGVDFRSSCKYRLKLLRLGYDMAW